ncbi:hypothetical protein DSO57_1002140 [Entomophthora muscae]|uniref:Uncharacterized protein n=1 Tax=Entomophthora muscae TaxID=34485 RepID=A0ACC2SLF1_9FUNG|nr:hypothetical protein DSO57_1002140 [Entomophthora muscae]
MKSVIIKDRLSVQVKPTMRCDLCFSRHKPCDKKVPACSRCTKSGIECTRNRRANLKSTISISDNVYGQLVPDFSTWEDVIQKHSLPLPSRYILRCFVLKLFPMPPSKTIYTKIMGSCSTIKGYLLRNPIPVEQSVIDRLQRFRIIATATRAFFHYFNPFFPLFSENGFHNSLRSPLLRAIVACIGLERMETIERSPLHTTMLIHITTLILESRVVWASPSLDTLQCRLLLMIGLKSEKVQKYRLMLAYSIPSVLSILGLHKDLPGPHRLERRLAFQCSCLASHTLNSSNGRFLSPAIWLPLTTADKKLYPRMLPYLADHIHFITNQTLFYMHLVTIAVLKEHIISEISRSPSSILANFIHLSKRRLISCLQWGWSGLHSRTFKHLNPHERTLLLQCKLFIVISFHYSISTICHYASYIPFQQLQSPISHKPITCTLSPSSGHGISSSLAIIRLVSFLNFGPFNVEYIQLLVAAVGFITIHYKAAILAAPEIKPILDRNLAIVRYLLKGVLQTEFWRSSSHIFLALMDLRYSNLKAP